MVFAALELMIFSEHRNQSIPALINKKLRILPHSLFCLNLQFDTKKVKMKEVNILAADQKEYLLLFYIESDSAFRFALLNFIFPSSRAEGQKRLFMRISITLCVTGQVLMSDAAFMFPADFRPDCNSFQGLAVGSVLQKRRRGK